MSALAINLGGGAPSIDLGELILGGGGEPGWALTAVLLINLGGAAVLALVARGVDGVWGARWPAVAHALWLLVLVELVVPPVLGVAILPPADEAAASSAIPDASPVARSRDSLAPDPPRSPDARPANGFAVSWLWVSWATGVGAVLVFSAR